jgi:PAS domain S-box-containing protein
MEKMFNWGVVELNEIGQKRKVETVRLNPFTLAFPKSLESDFLNHYYNNSIFQINISTATGALLFAFYIPFDLYLVPELFYEFLLLRVVLTCSIIISVVLLINKLQNKNVSQPLLSMVLILMGVINISFIILAYPKLNSYYYIGIILIYFWGYTFLKLRYVWASFAGITIFFVYEFALRYIVTLDTELYIISTFYLFASNLTGMGIAYALEYYSRRDYFQNLMLKKSFETNANLYTKISESDKEIDRAEEKLMLQSKALESAANSIIILDRSGNIIWCNSAFSKLTEYTSEEVVGKNPRIFKSDKHDKVFYKNLWSTILEGRVWSGEIINKKKSGEFYFEEMVITPVTGNGSDKISHFIAIKQDISFRKEMEDDLFESERRFRGLFENATMGIYRSSLDGEILMANNALLKMLGFESLEKIKQRGLTQAGYVYPDKRDEFIKKLKESGNLIGFETQWRRLDGSIIFVRESARLDYNESGEGIIEGTVEDISLSKLADIELREAGERLQTVFDNLYDAIIIHDQFGEIININSKVLDLYNISMEEAIGCSIKDISSKDNPLDTIAQYWQNVVAGGKTHRFEWKAMRPKDKFVFDVEVFLSKITLGKEDYVLSNIRDITEQKKAQKQLLITQKAVELNASPIFWISKESNFIYVNNAAVEKLGYTFEELLKMKVSEVDPSWTDKYWEEFGYEMLKEKGVAQFETSQKKKDGSEYPVEVNTSVINYEDEEVIIAIVNDITERKKDAENLIKAKEKAEQSDKLKSEFLAGMSHEIRTPINTILNYISLIRSDLGSNTTEDIKSSFEMIDSGSRRLIRTIDSIINMSQLQSGAYELKTELISIVDDVLDRLFQEFKQTAIQKHLTFEFDVKTKDTNVLVDLYTITQLFINLIDNALKYTNVGSVKIVVESEDEFIKIDISDTGIGIKHDFLPTLFEPFLQEEMGYTRSFEGNGLGLALVKKYIHLNNGSIVVDSKKGLGSIFTVKLPKPTEKQLNIYSVSKALN